MRMIMKSRSPCVPIVMAVMSALAVTAATTTTRRNTTWPTTETSGRNLNGKMFTLFRYGGGISFFSPYYSPTPSPWSTRSYNPTRRPYYPTRRPYYPTRRPFYTTESPYYPTSPYPTGSPYYPTKRPFSTTESPYYPTRRPYYPTSPYPTGSPWTTAPATRGVSVCLRYLADDLYSFFTLSPSSRSPLQLSINYGGAGYSLSDRRYNSQNFQPNLKFWSNIGPDIWTRICLTVDSMNNVAQMFSGPNISIRKILPGPYVWSGEPVIDFSGFDGQLTDIQIWDYPLRYREVFNYMTSGVYAPYRGSALSWSDISYSPRGQTLLEDTYEWQARQPIGSSGVRKGRRPKGGKKTWPFSNMV